VEKTPKLQFELLWEYLLPMVTRGEDGHGRAFRAGDVKFSKDCRPFTFCEKGFNKWERFLLATQQRRLGGLCERKAGKLIAPITAERTASESCPIIFRSTKIETFRSLK
jgi:hypothetical protein